MSRCLVNVPPYRASDIGLFRRTEQLGLQLQSWYSAHPQTAVIGTVSMYNIKVPNVQVRLQDGAVYV